MSIQKFLPAFTLLFLLNCPNLQAKYTLDDDLNIKQHWFSWTTGYNIATPSESLGTLYRRALSLTLHYDYYNPANVKMATAKARWFTWGLVFDIFDHENNKLGIVKEQLFTFFPTFAIYDPEGVTQLAKSRLNFWGTTFSLRDPLSGQEMAILSRPFFRWKNDWTFHVTNKEAFAAKNIDDTLLLTIMACQGDMEYFASHRHAYLVASLNHKNSSPHLQEDLAEAQAWVQEAIDAEAFLLPLTYTLEQQQALITEIESAYREDSANETATNLTEIQDQILNYVQYAIQYAQAQEVAKRHAIYHLLQERLENLQQFPA